MFQFVTAALKKIDSTSLLIACTAFLCAAPATKAETGQDSLAQLAGKPIRKIEFEGKFRLKRFILEHEIDSRPGQQLDLELIERDTRKIDGLGIFSQVDTYVVPEGDSVDIRFELREVWTLLPLVSIGRTDGKLDWALGVHERDFFGYYTQLAFLYRRYEGKNSGSLFVNFPRFAGTDYSVGLGISERKEIDPLSYHGVLYDYDYLAKAVSASVGYRFSENVYAAVSGGYDRENWQLKSEDSLGVLVREVDNPRYYASSTIVLGRIYANHYFYYGHDLGFDVAAIHEQPDGRFNKWRWSVTARRYTIWGALNLALRARYQNSTKDERVSPYSISGEANVRGYADKIERGDAALTANAELRLAFWDRRLFYGQFAGFVDYGAIWGRAKSFGDAIADPRWSIGLGIRGAIRQFLGRIGRADFAYIPEDNEFAIYLSASQFF